MGWVRKHIALTALLIAGAVASLSFVLFGGGRLDAGTALASVFLGIGILIGSLISLRWYFTT
jgi:hypothetical protein